MVDFDETSVRLDMEFSDQAVHALMLALQRCLLEQSDIVPLIKDMKLRATPDGLVVMNPPVVMMPRQEVEVEPEQLVLRGIDADV